MFIYAEQKTLQASPLFLSGLQHMILKPEWQNVELKSRQTSAEEDRDPCTTPCFCLSLVSSLDDAQVRFAFQPFDIQRAFLSATAEVSKLFRLQKSRMIEPFIPKFPVCIGYLFRPSYRFALENNLKTCISRRRFCLHAVRAHVFVCPRGFCVYPSSSALCW